MTAYTLNDSKMFMDIQDGIAIVINNETGIYYGFNAFGSAVLDALSQGMDKDVLLEKILSATTGNSTDNLPQLYSAFIDELLKDDILISAPAQEVDVQIDPQVIIDDQFELNVTPYADAQEMLLADPIHEVKEETGWTPEKDSIGYTKEETKEREQKVIS